MAKSIEGLEAEIDAARWRVEKPLGRLSCLLWSSEAMRQAASEALARILVHGVLERRRGLSGRRAGADLAVLHATTAPALAARKAERGAYPQRLADLVPAYLDAEPSDPFGDGPLKSRRAETGCTVYSVGANGIDDGGGNEDAAISLE